MHWVGAAILGSGVSCGAGWGHSFKYSILGLYRHKSLCHRVDRVLSFVSSRWNWDSHPLTCRRVCIPPPLVPGGGGQSMGEEGMGGPNSDAGTYTLWYSMYLCTSWFTLVAFCLYLIVTSTHIFPTFSSDKNRS
jgi:hypothetical protein